MFRDFFWISVTLGVIFVILMLAFWPTTKDQVVVVKYDCRMLMGGWHPDVPVRVQEECKKRNNK
jgi:hypothetical protein